MKIYEIILLILIGIPIGFVLQDMLEYQQRTNKINALAETSKEMIEARDRYIRLSDEIDEALRGVNEYRARRTRSTASRFRVELNGDITVEHEVMGGSERYTVPAYNKRRIDFITGNYVGEYWDHETRTEFTNCGGVK